LVADRAFRPLRAWKRRDFKNLLQRRQVLIVGRIKRVDHPPAFQVKAAVDLDQRPGGDRLHVDRRPVHGAFHDRRVNLSACQAVRLIVFAHQQNRQRFPCLQGAGVKEHGTGAEVAAGKVPVARALLILPNGNHAGCSPVRYLQVVLVDKLEWQVDTIRHAVARDLGAAFRQGCYCHGVPW
jgi:hypothetical protein